MSFYIAAWRRRLTRELGPFLAEDRWQEEILEMMCVIPVLKGVGLGLVSGLALFALIALPAYRRPWKIAGFHNIRMFKLALAMSWAGFWISFFAVLSGVCIDFSQGVLFWLAFLWFAVPPLLGTVWALYWDIPFFRKKTGKRAVDETIARYRLEGETVRAGLPRIVDKDGTRYVWVVYGVGGRVTASLAIREDTGEVVRSEEKMRYLSRCARMAFAMAYFGELYERMRSYQEGQKAFKAWPRAMRRFDRAVAFFQAEEGSALWHDIEALRRGWEIFKIHGEAMMKEWYQEGQWASEHGWEQIEEIPCEEMERLEDTLQMGAVLLTHLEEVRESIAAAKRLRDLLPQYIERARRWQKEQVSEYITLVLQMESAVHTLEEHTKEGRFYRFQPWTQEEETQWRERLRMVEG